MTRIANKLSKAHKSLTLTERPAVSKGTSVEIISVSSLRCRFGVAQVGSQYLGTLSDNYLPRCSLPSNPSIRPTGLKCPAPDEVKTQRYGKSSAAVRRARKMPSEGERAAADCLDLTGTSLVAAQGSADQERHVQHIMPPGAQAQSSSKYSRQSEADRRTYRMRGETCPCFSYSCSGPVLVVSELGSASLTGI